MGKIFMLRIPQTGSGYKKTDFFQTKLHLSICPWRDSGDGAVFKENMV